MDNIRKIIKIFFLYTSPQEVLSGNMEYNNVQQDSFAALANSYIPYYSNNEISNMFSFFTTEFEWHNNKMRGCETDHLRDISVFDSVILFADHVLVEENQMPLCRYEHLLRWRDMIISLDEDLFVTAFLAHKDMTCFSSRRNFFWPPVIGHNNKELNRLLAQGVAENHFHLKGSSPTFHLSWLSIMNDVANPEFRKVFEQYEKRRLHRKVSYQTAYAEHSLYISYLQAALIRLFLFACLKDDYFTLQTRYVPSCELMPFVCWEDLTEEDEHRVRRQLDSDAADIDGMICYLPAEVYAEMKKRILYRDVEEMLGNPDMMLSRLSDIQKNILQMRERYADSQLDYTISMPFLKESYDHLNEVICGERWFLYEIFKRIYSGDRQFSDKLNWFYAYILIKENIRAEMIQANNSVGFHNFLLYQNRKESLIENTPFEKIYLQMAVRDTIKNQHIKKLEARITPKKTAEALKRSIINNDACIMEKEKPGESGLKEKFFYVCHFIKEPDEGLDQLHYYGRECRHYKKRTEVKEQALAIYNFRKRWKDTAGRLKGIDAASEEIGCRPEVFSQAFRFLRNRSAEGSSDGRNPSGLPDLCITYHVGEDFLDIADGLRAIDEAVSFLNLRCGDRLGHALALGIDAGQWYESKSGRILIAQMDYLDNLVWLYAVIRKYRIEGCEDTVRYIEKRYDEYFRIVYLNNMNGHYLKTVNKEAVDYYEKKKIQNNYGFDQYYFSINTYYDSWKLRGDNPECYKSGYFRLNEYVFDEWNDYNVNKVFPENYRIRYNPEAAFLYHTYHYNPSVKKEGDKKKEIKVNPCIIKAVRAVQKIMQREIALKGLCIETNPSSNALIGTFKRYDRHPILNWYNIGLPVSREEAKEAPQLQVSINTDDQGVFATYIENEYAYLALALEKMKDKEGRPGFSRTVIYQWLDHVRKMGLVQSFDQGLRDECDML